VTDGIEAALEQAKSSAGGRDVKIGGGVETFRQYLRAGLIDEMHFALCPVVLGQGEAIFAGIDLPALGYRVTERQASDLAHTSCLVDRRSLETRLHVSGYRTDAGTPPRVLVSPQLRPASGAADRQPPATRRAS
jgi:hypothetical protein